MQPEPAQTTPEPSQLEGGSWGKRAPLVVKEGSHRKGLGYGAHGVEIAGEWPFKTSSDWRWRLKKGRHKIERKFLPFIRSHSGLCRHWMHLTLSLQNTLFRQVCYDFTDQFQGTGTKKSRTTGISHQTPEYMMLFVIYLHYSVNTNYISCKI